MNRLIAPSTDFGSVRDGRNSQVFYVDVALDTARTAGGSGANAALVLPISGNAFYCDANPGDGNAYVHFQDTNFDRGPTPLYVSPGVIFNIPFTRVLIENTAQPGKKIRIVYGIDVDFQPGSVAQIAVTNSGGYTAMRPESSTGFFSSVSAIAALTAETFFTPAQNPNGAIILAAGFNSTEAAANGSAFICHTAAPANFTTGEIILGSNRVLSGAAQGDIGTLSIPQYVPAGKGLYYLTGAAGGASNANLRYARWKAL